MLFNIMWPCKLSVESCRGVIERARRDNKLRISTDKQKGLICLTTLNHYYNKEQQGNDLKAC